MNRDARKLLVVNALYALIPLLLAGLPLLFSGMAMEAYGPGYALYMIGMEAGIIALPVLLFFRTSLGREVQSEGFWQRPKSALLLVLPLALCAYFFVNGVTACWLALLQALGLSQAAAAVPSPQTPGELAVALLVVAVVPALSEEFFFRGVLLPRLARHFSPAAAILLGGALFALVHGDLASLPGHLLLGAGLALAAYWTRSIWYTALWHFLQNGIAVLILYVSPRLLELTAGAQTAQSAALAEEPLMLLAGGLMLLVPFGLGTALFLFLLWLTTKEHRPLPLPRAEGRLPGPAFAPLGAGLLCALLLYVLSGLQMAGVGL